MKSSRMPADATASKPPKRCNKINGIKIPSNMTANQRRSTIAKVNNAQRIKNQRLTRAERVNMRKSLEG